MIDDSKIPRRVYSRCLTTGKIACFSFSRLVARDVTPSKGRWHPTDAVFTTPCTICGDAVESVLPASHGLKVIRSRLNTIDDVCKNVLRLENIERNESRLGTACRRAA